MFLSRSAAAWRPVLQHPDLSSLQRRWLTATGSLTARLQAHSQQFSLHLLQQNWQTPMPDERACLNMRAQQKARVREVLLLADGQHCIFAHSVLAPQPPRGRWQLFARTGQRPLGAALFTDPRIHRHTLHYRRLDRRHPLYRAAVHAVMTHAANTRQSAPTSTSLSASTSTSISPPLSSPALPAQLWARRSLFTRGRQTMLVCEVFLPAVYRS